MKTRALATALAVSLAGCASDPPRSLLENARHAHAEGNLERALRYTERAIQHMPDREHEDDVVLQVALLRELGRDAAADALADFQARRAAGEDTDAPLDPDARDECLELQRERSRVDALVRRWADFPLHSYFEIGTVAARFGVDREGRPVEIRVLRARHPAAAWLVIHAIDEARISTARVAAVEPEDFPVPHCVYWEYYGNADGAPMPPELRAHRERD